MKNNKWIFDGDQSVTTKDNKELVFYTTDLKCSDDIVNKIVRLYNDNEGKSMLGSKGLIDQYLMNEGSCSQEDREIIVESIYSYYERAHNQLLSTIEQVNNDYTDDDNYCYIDVYFMGDEQGKAVAVVDRDNGKVFFIDNGFRNEPLVIEAIKEVKESLK